MTKKNKARKKSEVSSPKKQSSLGMILALTVLVLAMVIPLCIILFSPKNTVNEKNDPEVWNQYQLAFQELEKQGPPSNYENKEDFAKNHFGIARWCKENEKHNKLLAGKYKIHMGEVVKSLSKYPEIVQQDPMAYEEAWKSFGYQFDSKNKQWEKPGGKSIVSQKKATVGNEAKNKVNEIQEVLGEEVAFLVNEQFELYCQEGGWFSAAIYLEQFLPRLTKVYQEIVEKHQELKKNSQKLQLLIFGKKKAYQEFAMKHRPEAADEAGVYFPNEKRLIILRERPEYGKALFENEALFHPGNFYDMVLSKKAGKPIVITKAEVAATEVLGDKVAKHRTKHYFVAVQYSTKYDAQKRAIEAGKTFEELYRNFYLQFRPHFPELKDVDRLMPYFIFRDNKEYIAYRKRDDRRDNSAEFAGGHYEPWTKRMMTFYTEGDEGGWAQEVIFHEGTHQLMHFIADYNDSNMMWFSEGVADYIAGFRMLANGKFVVGEINKDNYLKFLLYLKTNPKALMSAKEVLEFTDAQKGLIFSKKNRSDEEKSFLFGRVYYQGWMAVYYFLKGPNEEHRKLFLDYFAAELKGKGGLKKIKETFHKKLDLEKLDQDIKKFALSLIKKNKK